MHREVEERYRLVEACPDGILICSQGMITYANPSAAELFGVGEAEELQGRPLVALIDEPFYERLAAKIVKSCKDQADASSTTVQLRHGNQVVLADATPARVSFLGRPGILLFFRRLSDGERELEASRLRYVALVETEPDAIVSFDGQGRIVSWNLSAQRMFDYHEDQVIGGPLSMLVAERCRPALAERLEGFLQTGDVGLLGDTMELLGIRRDGTEFPIELSVAAWQDDEAWYLTGIIRDISERRAAEEASRASENRYRSLFEQSPVAMLELDLTQIASRLTEPESPELRRVIENAERRRQVLGLIRITAANREAVELLEAADEQELLGPINPDRMEEEALLAIGRQLLAFQDGLERHETETVLPTKKGNRIRCRLRWAVPVALGEPDLARVVLVLEDVTEQRRAQAALEQMVRAQDEFISSVGHELRTPLTAVLGFSEIVRDDWRDLAPEERLELLDLISRQSQEAASGLDDLSVAARGAIETLILSPRPVDLLEQLRMIWSGLPPEVAARVELPGDAGREITVDAARLRQVLRNLLTAAARTEECRIWIQTRHQGRWARVLVWHDGPALPEGERLAVFDGANQPIHRLDRLSLSVSSQLARRMGGDLTYQSKGLRHCFVLVLPQSDDGIKPEGRLEPPRLVHPAGPGPEAPSH
jgi:PAS domain S-box-containing protein